MQFTRNLKTIKIYALTILILSLAISISAKNLLSINFKSEFNTKAETETILQEKNEEITPSFLQSSERTTQFPKVSETKDNFDKYLAIKMLLDIGRYIIRNFQNHETYITYNKCIGSIKDNLASFEPHLKLFWHEMHKISKNEDATELKNKDVITNIFKKLYEKNVNLDIPKIEKKCKSVLIIQPKILRRDLNTILTRDQYFGGLASMRQKPFIDSMFSVYRQNLPPNAFEVLNRSSRGLESFKINSEGLTDIAVATPAELKKARSAKRPVYGVEESYFGKIQNAKFGNFTANAPNKTAMNSTKNMVTKSQRIHLLNSNSVEFPGESGDNLENVEVPLNATLAGKNIVINRKITYPKEVENAVKNQLANSNLLPGLNGKIVNATQNSKGQEEIYVHVRNEDEGASESEGALGETGANEDANYLN